MRQLLTAFGTNTPACWRAEDIDLPVETGCGCPFAWTMFPHPRHCASFRRHGESGLAVVVQGLIDLGQWCTISAVRSALKWRGLGPSGEAKLDYAGTA